MKKIKFGTDGWRGVLAKDFTLQNLRILVQAITDYLNDSASEGAKVLCGYDTRFMSKSFAVAAAEVCCGNGLRAIVSENPIPTPVLSYAVAAEQAAFGLMITASHNPFWFNGLKLKEASGASASPRTTASVEARLGKSEVKAIPFREAAGVCLEGRGDFEEFYKNSLTRLFDREVLKGVPGPLVFDCMHGAAGVSLRNILGNFGLQAEIVNENPDPYFGGVNPEPLPENLSATSEKTRAEGFSACFAFDGDGDRVGVLDEDGRFLMPYEVMCLLISHLVKNRGLTGSVVKTVSSSTLIDKVAARFGLNVIEVPVGFKNMCGYIESGEALIGGEENGGFGFKCHIPERDGLISALMLIEMTAAEGKTIKELSGELIKNYGRVHHRRLDGRIPPARHEGIMDEIAGAAEQVYGKYGIEDIKRTDGLKILMRDGSWVLFRASGTEPLLRIYSEAGEPALLDKLISAGKEAFLG